MTDDRRALVDPALLRSGKGPFDAGSVDFGIAGEAQRRARHAASLLCGRRGHPGELQPFHLQVLAVICDLTASYSKLADRTSARQIAAMTLGVDTDDPEVVGGRRERVSKALDLLNELEIISYRARGDHGPNAGVYIALPPARVVVEQDHDSGGVVVEQDGVMVEQDPESWSSRAATPSNSEHLSEQQQEPVIEVDLEDLDLLAEWIGADLPVDWLEDGATECVEGVPVSDVARNFLDKADNHARHVWLRWCRTQRPQRRKPKRRKPMYEMFCRVCNRPARGAEDERCGCADPKLDRRKLDEAA